MCQQQNDITVLKENKQTNKTIETETIVCANYVFLFYFCFKGWPTQKGKMGDDLSDHKTKKALYQYKFVYHFTASIDC